MNGREVRTGKWGAGQLAGTVCGVREEEQLCREGRVRREGEGDKRFTSLFGTSKKQDIVALSCCSTKS